MTTLNVSEGRNHTLSCTSTQLEDSDEFFDSMPYQANMSKRRNGYVELQGQENTQSRVNQIKNIFEEAVPDLVSSFPSLKSKPRQIDGSKPDTLSSTNKAVRLSVHKTDSDYLESSLRTAHRAALSRLPSSQTHDISHPLAFVSVSPPKFTRKPLSNGNNTPSRIPRPIRDFSTVKLTAGLTYGEDSDDEDVHSTHGVPLILPIRSKEAGINQSAPNISQWLKTVESSKFNENSKTTVRSAGKTTASFPAAINNKENSRPQNSLTNPYTIKSHLSLELLQPASGINGSYNSNNNCVPNGSTKEFSQHTYTANKTHSKRTPPSGLLLMPPRRIGQTPNMPASSQNVDMSRQIKSLCRKPKGSQTESTRCHSAPSSKQARDDDLIELSPSVNRNRRHRGQARNSNTGTKQSLKNSSADIEIVDLVLALEEYDREEEERRDGNTYGL